jgi:hypothetical protein
MSLSEVMISLIFQYSNSLNFRTLQNFVFFAETIPRGILYKNKDSLKTWICADDKLEQKGKENFLSIFEELISLGVYNNDIIGFLLSCLNDSLSDKLVSFVLEQQKLDVLSSFIGFSDTKIINIQLDEFLKNSFFSKFFELKNSEYNAILNNSKMIEALTSRGLSSYFPQGNDFCSATLEKIEHAICNLTIKESDDILYYNSLIQLLLSLPNRDNVELLFNIVKLIITFEVSSLLNSSCTEILRRNTELRWCIIRKFFECEWIIKTLFKDNIKRDEIWLKKFLDFSLNELSDATHVYIGDIFYCVQILTDLLHINEDKNRILSLCWQCYCYCSRKTSVISNSILKLYITPATLLYDSSFLLLYDS